jgi:hypothetical protein
MIVMSSTDFMDLEALLAADMAALDVGVDRALPVAPPVATLADTSADSVGVMREYLDHIKESFQFADGVVKAVTSALGSVAESAAAAPLSASDVERTVAAAAIGASLDCAPSENALAVQLRLPSVRPYASTAAAAAEISPLKCNDQFSMSEIDCPAAASKEVIPMFMGDSYLGKEHLSAGASIFQPSSSGFFCLSPTRVGEGEEADSQEPRPQAPCADDWLVEHQRLERSEENRLADILVQLELEAAAARVAREAAQRAAKEAETARCMTSATLRLQTTARGFITRKRVRLRERLIARAEERRLAEEKAKREVDRVNAERAAAEAEEIRQNVIRLSAARRQVEELAAEERRKRDAEAAAAEILRKEQAAVEAAKALLAAKEAAAQEAQRQAELEAAAAVERQRAEAAAALERERTEAAAALERERADAAAALERERAEAAAALEREHAEAAAALQRELAAAAAAVERERAEAAAALERQRVAAAIERQRAEEAEAKALAEAERARLAEEERVRSIAQALANHEAATAKAALDALAAEDLRAQVFRRAVSKRSRIESIFGVGGDRAIKALPIAVCLQALWRGGRERRGARGLLVSKEIMKRRLLRNRACTMIQALWRGALLRMAIARAVECARYADTDLDDFAAVDVDDFLGSTMEMFNELTMPASDISRVAPVSSPSPPAAPAPVVVSTAPILFSTAETAADAPGKISSPLPRQSPTETQRFLDLVPQTSVSYSSSISQKRGIDVSPRESSQKTKSIIEDWGVSSPAVVALFMKRRARMSGLQPNTPAHSAPLFVSTVHGLNSFSDTSQQLTHSSFVGRVRGAVRSAESLAIAVAQPSQRTRNVQDNLPDSLRPARFGGPAPSDPPSFTRPALIVEGVGPKARRAMAEGGGKENSHVRR